MTVTRDAALAGPRSERADLFLSAAAIVALAVAQPLLDLLGRTPPFFIARAASTFEVVMVGLVLGIGLPLVVAAAAAGGHALNRYAGLAVHGAVMTVGGGLLVAEALQHTPAAGWPGWVQLAVAGIAGVTLVLAYHRAASIRGMLRYGAVAPLAVAALFLVVAPTSRLVWGTSGVAMAAGPVANPAPVVMVIFDEFPVATLIDGTGQIRGDQFPGFARLAADSTWFRNAVGVHERTEQALPAMLSGRLALDDERAPSAADYPDTLFSLMEDGYRVEAVESVTALCPTTVCVDGSRRRPPLADWWSSLAGDLAVVAGHVLLPTHLAAGLPPIDQGWSGFLASEASPEVEPPQETPLEQSVNRRFNQAVDNDRRRALASFEFRFDDPLAADRLFVGHFLLPHSPWTILPDGRRYSVARVPPGDWSVWTQDAWVVEQAYQSHLLQVQFVDRFVGDLIDRLEELDSYEDALVVVTADHGVAIRPGTDRRTITADNVGEVAAVPLFVKRAGQLQGQMSDYRAETTDILPTVAALLGVGSRGRSPGSISSPRICRHGTPAPCTARRVR
ncbi:MAG: sulfatase-like hydrolase/transferase [Actinomycetota bacterium]|nr:sulfatase-like hydrolase/transferase [Actinomycetota bacterium]